jgi:peptidoglycan/xylan/chitin deacetylase (PgdA/CDA1 family)
MLRAAVTLTVLIASLAAGLSTSGPAAAQGCPGNPDALGVSRTVEIDTTGGPAFGLEQYKIHDFLAPGEIVLTFDDGPWPGTTPAVLDALAAHCTKATFFIIGKHALWHPDILKRVAGEGHTIGTHTFSHANLNDKRVKKDGNDRAEIEKGISAVKTALGAPPSPFFRFPFLQDPPEMITYLAERNLAAFSMDLDSFDFKHRKPEAVTKSVLDKLAGKGKGIILMHDFQKPTAAALPDLLKKLKAAGYKIVHMKAREPVISLAEFDDAIAKEFAGPLLNARPTSSVVRTITGN